MDCELIRKIYEKSCNYNNIKDYSESFLFSEDYYQNEIQVKVEKNCLKAIELLNKLKCNNQQID
jgi:hypothetical protein